MVNLFEKNGVKFNTVEFLGNDSFIKENTWIHLVNPSEQVLKTISDKTNIDYDLLLSTLDEEETAHLDSDDDCTMIVIDIPHMQNNEYITIPFIIIYNKSYYITICTKYTEIIQLVLQKNKVIEPHKHVRLTLQLLYAIANSYINYLKRIDNHTKEVEKILHTSMKNKEIFDLLNINKSLVYFSTSLNSNKILLNKLNRIPEYSKYEDDFELMEDVVIENNQAVEMCSIYRDILSGTMDAFASVISNNLNIVMKVLAIVTLVISIPTLVASFFGMNLILPFQNNPYGFIIVMAISLLIVLIGGLLLIQITKRQNK